MDLWVIIYAIVLGAIYAGAAYKSGQLGQTGTTVFNYVKGGLVIVVGAAFGFYVAYTGGTVNPDVIVQMFSLFTVGTFGIIWLIDTIATYIAAYLQPKSGLAQGMAKPAN